MPPPPIDAFKGYRFPREIISHAVWLYYRFSLSLRDVEDLLAYRGIEVSHQTIHEWERRFGPLFADVIRRNRPKPGDTWYLDEVVIRMNGELFYLWRAVDQQGDVLDILVQKRRNKKAARRFLEKLVATFGDDPRVLVTDKLRSYGAAKKEVMPNVDHRQHKGLNNRAEASHKATRRERVMQRFKSPPHAQRFCAAHDQINTLFRAHRHRLSKASYRHARNDAFGLWDDVTTELVTA